MKSTTVNNNKVQNNTNTSTTNKFYYYLNQYWLIVIKLLLWLIIYYYSIKFEFGLFYLIITIIYLIINNLSSTSNGNQLLSAYSVFNPNQERLLGNLNPEQFEREIRYSTNNNTNNNPNTVSINTVNNTNNSTSNINYSRHSKFANKPCYCGSLRKYKLCCSIINPAQLEKQKTELQQWEKDWT